ncbi:TlpA family protein disulfide reductase [Gluconobacter roseus]|uniref:TlpA family protein disulfide reductase n=1 Tax=Gluconobacter roseus TaxID=586239 RepID=UPI0038D09F61
MKTAPVSRRNVVWGTVGLAVLAGFGASRLAGLVVRHGAPVASLVPGRPMLEPVGFGLAGPDGARESLLSRRGSSFLLHVWATWCLPCRHELPALAAFMHAWGVNCPIVPVAVSSGSPEAVRTFLVKNDVPGFPAWTVDDSALKAWMGHGELAIPVTILIDGAGRVRASAAGSLDWAGSGAAAALHRILAETRG